MSLSIDLSSIGDLIALAGTDADRRAWLRIRAHVDRQAELIKISDSEQCRRLAAELERLKAGRGDS